MIIEKVELEFPLIYTNLKINNKNHYVYLHYRDDLGYELVGQHLDVQYLEIATKLISVLFKSKERLKLITNGFLYNPRVFF